MNAQVFYQSINNQYIPFNGQEKMCSTTNIIRAIIISAIIFLIIFLYLFMITSITRPQISANVSITYDNAFLYIQHQGGNPIDKDQIHIILGQSEIPHSDFHFLNNASWPFSIGKTLIIPYFISDRERVIRIDILNNNARNTIYSDILPTLTITPTLQINEPSTDLHTSTPTLTLTPTPTPTRTPTPSLPVASFNATPRNGPVPLAVQFTDTSTGIPEEWLWTFGDGATSPLQDPVHTYTEVGSYQVGLAVRNAFGGHTRISQGYITVTPAEERSLYLEAQRGAIVLPAGFVEFSVTKPGARVKIGGQTLDMPPGSRIRLTIDEGGKGKISLRDGTIVLFFFEKVILSINGTESARGTVQDIVVPGYDSLISSINLEIEGGKGDLRILESGLPSSLVPGESPLFLSSLRPDPSGVLNLDCYREDTTVFRGAVTSYRVE